MPNDKKLAILIALIIMMIIVWVPKGRRRQQVSPKVPVSIEKPMSRITPVQRKRTGFADWGKNPFIWYREGSNTVAGLTLSGIIWDDEASYAIINGAIVHTGDKIAGKTVKRIESDKVILSDGLMNYVLELE